MIYLKEMQSDQEEEVKALYEELFPPIERKPFPMMKQLATEGKATFLMIYDEEIVEPVGFCYLLLHGDMILWDYFAVKPRYQSKGYGGITLKEVARQNPTKRIFGEIEPPDQKAPNNEMRIRRKNFYLRNGVKETGILLDLFGCELEVMYMGDVPVTLEEYLEFQRAIIGKEAVEKNIHLI